MADYKTFSDSDLIACLKIGDTIAYTEIYNRYYYLMFVFAYKKIRDEDLAKDILQDFFTNFWEKRESLASINNFTSYLYTAIRNRVFDFIAHQHVNSKYIQSIAEYSLTNYNSTTDHLVREKQLKAYIENAINELPIKMREIFLLSRKSELSYKEIAKKLSISERTVNNQISNALHRLKIKLGIYVIILLSI